ncbi:MAG: hypothetical protein DMF84_11525 [Acidobacteria bacterium]|nr:MAG: hypothetical protein DMF84_11525 [Acidobacteriota bacterium]
MVASIAAAEVADCTSVEEQSGATEGLDTRTRDLRMTTAGALDRSETRQDSAFGRQRALRSGP